MNRFGDIDSSFKRLPPVYGYHSEKLVSLEQALEPITALIDELPRYIKVAKQYCHFPSEHGLSKDQSASVYIYTMEWGETTLYRMLNAALRSEDRQALKIWFPYLKLFDTALDRLPTYKGVLWRGVSLDIGKDFAKNQLITWWSVNSCTLSVDVIKGFLGNKKNCTLFLIESNNGKEVSGYTAYDNEDEVILRMGTQFRVKANGLNHPDGSHVVHLVQIDDSDQEASTTAKPVPMPHLSANAKWQQNGVTVAGGQGQGSQLNQLSLPFGICIDDDEQCIYVADCYNHRVVKFKYNGTSGQIVAGGNGEGCRMGQLSFPTDVLLDKQNEALIIADLENRQVLRWSLRNETDREVIITDVRCSRLAMDGNGDLYVADWDRHEVRRWTAEKKDGVLVAGGNGKGNQLNQLNTPTAIYVDQDGTVYVCDNKNHRVMAWQRGAKQGVVVAGSKTEGKSLSQLSHPQGLLVDQSGCIYVADSWNHRVMRYSKDAREVFVVLGGNGAGDDANQFNRLGGLAFDRQGNLYAVDNRNHRVQKFCLSS